ncbi:MAG: hypothetical protein QM504_16050 [Pseudomonadota bacterium]
MKKIKLILSLFVMMILVSACNEKSTGSDGNVSKTSNVLNEEAVQLSLEVIDCNWVGASVKDCVVFEGTGDLMKVFKGPGRYAVRYLNTADWIDFNLYRATSYAFGSSSITVTDINGVDMTGLYQITYGANSASTGIPVGQISSDVTLIYDVEGIDAAVEVEFKNACSWSGWC